MDIITENKLLRENYALRQENDQLKESLERSQHIAASRRQILSEIAVNASSFLSSVQREKLFDHATSEHVRGQIRAYDYIFTRMQQLASDDPDLLQIIADPVARVESWTEYVRGEVRRMNDEHWAKIKKRKKAGVK